MIHPLCKIWRSNRRTKFQSLKNSLIKKIQFSIIGRLLTLDLSLSHWCCLKQKKYPQYSLIKYILTSNPPHCGIPLYKKCEYPIIQKRPKTLAFLSYPLLFCSDTLRPERCSLQPVILKQSLFQIILNCRFIPKLKICSPKVSSRCLIWKVWGSCVWDEGFSSFFQNPSLHEAVIVSECSFS